MLYWSDCADVMLLPIKVKANQTRRRTSMPATVESKANIKSCYSGSVCVGQETGAILTSTSFIFQTCSEGEIETKLTSVSALKLKSLWGLGRADQLVNSLSLSVALACSSL